MICAVAVRRGMSKEFLVLCANLVATEIDEVGLEPGTPENFLDFASAVAQP